MKPKNSKAIVKDITTMYALQFYADHKDGGADENGFRLFYNGSCNTKTGELNSGGGYYLQSPVTETKTVKRIASKEFKTASTSESAPDFTDVSNFINNNEVTNVEVTVVSGYGQMETDNYANSVETMMEDAGVDMEKSNVTVTSEDNDDPQSLEINTKVNYTYNEEVTETTY